MRASAVLVGRRMDAARGCALAGGCHGVSPPGEQTKTALWPVRWAENASHGQPTTDVNNGDWEMGGAHWGCVSAHLEQAEGRAWPAGPAGPAGSRPRAPAAPAESHDGEDAAARRSSPSLARAPSPCEDFGQGACSGQPLSGRNMRPARQSPRKLANTRRGLKDQSQTGHRTRAKNWRKGAGHCGRCCRCPRKAHPSGSSPTPLLMRHGDQRPVGQ